MHRSIDDGEYVGDTTLLLGRLFLSMLARLERQGLMSSTSEVQNLGLIMALFISFAKDAREMGCLEPKGPKNITPIGPKPDKKQYRADRFDAHILAYADKYAIPLVGPHRMARLVDDIRGSTEDAADLPVPDSNADEKADPFGWGKALKKYKADHACSPMQTGRTSDKNKIGGDFYDITTWSSAERKKHSYDKEDPISRTLISKLEQGEIMTPA